MKNKKFNNEIIYTIKLKFSSSEERSIFETCLHDAVIGKTVLYGLRLENITNSNFYFSTPEQAFIIIPHDWVEWMVPNKIKEQLLIKNAE